MLDALLILVVGLEGGPDAEPAEIALVLLAERIIGAPAGGARVGGPMGARFDEAPDD
jgi:hypothetical protein